MYELTDEWLEQINERFRQQDIPYRRRPWEAWHEWAAYVGVSTSLGDDEVRRIFDWFEKNSKTGSQNLGALFKGSFYFDSCFWVVRIPVVYGERVLKMFNSLSNMPDQIKGRLMKNYNECQEYFSVWADCFDYGFGIDGLIGNENIATFGEELFRSGDQQLNATVTLLHEERPNSKAIESARMTTELFLKAFLASRGLLTSSEAQFKIRHDLNKALDKCLEVDASSELRLIRSSLTCFPSQVGERYKGTEHTQRELWLAYRVAQFTAATVVRAFSCRDVRKTMR